MYCGPAGATVAVAFITLQLPRWRRGSPRRATSRLDFDESAIAMTVEINLRRSRGWPGTSPTQRCLWGEPRTVISRALLDAMQARVPGQPRARGSCGGSDFFLSQEHW